MIWAAMSPIEHLVAALSRANLTQAELARRIGKRPGHIWAWINRDHRVPAEMCKPIEHATGGLVTRHELRPDIFDPPAEPVTEEARG